MAAVTDAVRFAHRLDSCASHVGCGMWPLDVQRACWDVGTGMHAGYRARRGLAASFGETLATDEHETAALLLGELVSNAVRHGGGGDDDVIVYLAVGSERIRAEVCDSGPGFDPASITPRGTPAGGFGLVLLDRLASRWGVSSEGESCVWFEMDRPLLAGEG